MWLLGDLAGPVNGACDTWSLCCEFEPHIGLGVYLKKIIVKIKNKNVVT